MNSRNLQISGGFALAVVLLSPLMMMGCSIQGGQLFQEAPTRYDISKPTRVEQLFQEASTLYEKGDYQNALLSYTTLVTVYPDNVFSAMGKLGIANCHFKLQAWRAAVQAYQRFISEHRDKTDFLSYCSYQIGESYYRLGTQQKEAGKSEVSLVTLELALSWYQKTIDEFPRDELASYARYGAILALKELGRQEELETRAHAFIRRYKQDDEFGTLIASIQSLVEDVNPQESMMSRGKKVEQLLQEAYALYKKGDYDNALVSYTTFLKTYPESTFIAEAKLWIAHCHFRLQAWRKAASAYKSVINEHRDKTDFMSECSYWIGESYHRLGYQQKEAGKSELGMGTLELALSWYQKVIDDFPRDELASYARCGVIWTLHELGRREEFKMRARTFIHRYKQDNEFGTLAAKVQRLLEDVNQQESMLSHAKKVEQLFKEAEALDFQKHEHKKAIPKYSEALEKATKYGLKMKAIAPDFRALVNYRIAVCYYFLAGESSNANHYHTALRYIHKIPATANLRNEQDGLTYFWGQILYETKQFASAERKFRELIENFPNSQFVAGAWGTIGRLNYELKNYAESRRAFKALLNRFPNYELKHYALLGIADSFYDEKNYQQAYRAFDKVATEAFKDYPNLQAEALFKAAYSLTMLGRHYEAIARYTNLVTRFPKHPNVPPAYFNLGVTYEREKDYDKALLNYRAALRKTTDATKKAEVQSRINTVIEARAAQRGISKSQTPFQNPRSNSSEKKPLQPQEIAKKSLRSTMFVEIKNAYGKVIRIGSGFFITEHHIVTNWHVIEGAATAYATHVDGKTTYKIVELTAKNVRQDLAILKVSGKGIPLPLGDSDTIQVGEPIYAAGNPEGWMGTFSEGLISGIRMRQNGRRIQFSAPTSQGSSGGALLNNKGEVIGIVSSGYRPTDAQNLNFAIPVNYLKALIRR